MHKLSSQLAIAAVAAILGLLVVVQVRSQAGPSGLAQLSSQDLTVLVANLNARNDQLRREGSSLEQELATLTANRWRRVALERDLLPAHAVRSATAGGIRDARTAGISPANAPIRMAETMPPDHASAGITTAQPFALA